jgi:hypothetical protein
MFSPYQTPFLSVAHRSYLDGLPAGKGRPPALSVGSSKDAYPCVLSTWPEGDSLAREAQSAAAVNDAGKGGSRGDTSFLPALLRG